MLGAFPLALVVLLGGCVASALPDDALRSVNREVTVSELRRDPGAHVGERVLVGGEILATRPGPGETEIELLSRPLAGDDRPARSDLSEGRVLVRTKEFLDPAVYAPERRVTMVGTVVGGEERKLGELPYRYPVISVEYLQLWPREPPPPVFYPVYPWGWPYYYYPWRFRRS